MVPMILRPVRDTDDDAATVAAIAKAAFTALEESLGTPRTEPSARDLAANLARTRHLARTDPGGCWLAEEDGRAVGCALSLRREGLWGLSLLVVLPEAQGKGVGRTLLDHALAWGRGCLRGIVVASPDPRAARRYHAAGFRLHPTMVLSGPLDPAKLPDPDGVPVHLGGPEHFALLDSVDRATRGAGHREDHGLLLRHSDELLVADTLAGSGYCYRTGGRVVQLAATSKRLASRLLVEALGRMEPGAQARIGIVTAEQDWAVDTALAAGLAVTTRGYLALRGMRPPAPYLPSGSYL